jgi:hypothetical protein
MQSFYRGVCSLRELPKVINCLIGKNSPNQVTLVLDLGKNDQAQVCFRQVDQIWRIFAYLLGDFSPIGRLFTFGSFFKKTLCYFSPRL